ncbi:MAG: hypothetical protein IKQ13_12570 [Treponema sp.]|nr:hypothetical protein [Treponema sp.]
MITSDKLAARRAPLHSESDKTLNDVDALAKESLRVADLAQNSRQTIMEIEEKFEKHTKLQGKDIAFVFLATALQVCRQYLLTSFTDSSTRKGDQETARNTFGEKLLDPHDATTDRKHRLYNPSLAEIISHPVPFDAIKGSDGELAGYGRFGHRGATLGHDPVLGWIFGTANIATSTLTTAKFESFHIGSEGRDFFKCRADTTKVLSYTVDKLIKQGIDGKLIIAASIAKEAVHLMSDIDSKNSLPLPVITTVSPELSNVLANYGMDMSNLLMIGKQASVAEAINLIIAIIHRLTYNPATDGDDERLFQVRTRRIITTSMSIASGSNLIICAAGTALGVGTGDSELIKKSLRKLDIGGFIVTLRRIISDKKFIQQLKTEYVFGGFDKMIQGDVE